MTTFARKTLVAAMLASTALTFAATGALAGEGQGADARAYKQVAKMVEKSKQEPGIRVSKGLTAETTFVYTPYPTVLMGTGGK